MHLQDIWEEEAGRRKPGGSWEEEAGMRQLDAGKHLGGIWEAFGSSLEAVLRLAGKHLGGIWELPGGSWRQSWGSEVPDASEREKVAYVSAKMQKFLFLLDFTMCF